MLAPADRTAAARCGTVGLGLPAPVTTTSSARPRSSPAGRASTPRAAAEARFGVPVHVENDANLGALAEHRQGAGRGHSSLVFVKIASGVGAGIVVDDQLFHGADGTAGEIGHLTIDEQGPMCRCGSRGCLEAYTSSEHILRLVCRDAARRDPARTSSTRRPPATSRPCGLLEDAGLHLGWGLASRRQPAQPRRRRGRRRHGARRRPAARPGPHRACAATRSTRSPRRRSSRASSAAARAWWVRVLLAAERTELVAD